MSKEERVKMVTPQGKIVFIKNLFTPNTKGKYTASILFNKSQDLTRLKSEMRKVALKKFDEKIVNSKKFKWGLKSPDEEAIEKYDFFTEDTLILNTTTQFPIPVVGKDKAADGDYEELIEGDIKAGDLCVFVISPYAWENDDQGVSRGVSFNLEIVQKRKDGEALYSRRSATEVMDSFDLSDLDNLDKGESEDAPETVDGDDAYDW